MQQTHSETGPELSLIAWKKVISLNARKVEPLQVFLLNKRLSENTSITVYSKYEIRNVVTFFGTV